jgi:hypothetical protein
MTECNGLKKSIQTYTKYGEMHGNSGNKSRNNSGKRGRPNKKTKAYSVRRCDDRDGDRAADPNTATIYSQKLPNNF